MAGLCPLVAWAAAFDRSLGLGPLRYWWTPRHALAHRGEPRWHISHVGYNSPLAMDWPHPDCVRYYIFHFCWRTARRSTASPCLAVRGVGYRRTCFHFNVLNYLMGSSRAIY